MTSEDSLYGFSSVGDNTWEHQFPCEFPYEWNSTKGSSFSSPVESFAGSNETESEEEDDYIAGLAERVAHSMLDDDEESINENSQLKNRNWTFELKDLWAADKGKASMTLSPQSTLPGLGSWSASNWSSPSGTSSKGSSRVSSQVSSPPSTPLAVQEDAWELIFAAAEEVVRLKMLEEARASAACPSVRNELRHTPASHNPVPSHQSHVPWGHSYASALHGTRLPPGQPKVLQTRSKSFSSDSAVINDRAIVQDENLQRSLNAKTKDEERKERKPLGCQHRAPKPGSTPYWARQVKSIQQQHGSAVFRSGQRAGSIQRAHWVSDSFSTQWPPLQTAGGSGMRAVFLGSNGLGRESGGTGVFLPRRPGNGPDSKKKPSCSTVLLPTRIVQALNLNVEDALSPPIGSGTLTREATKCKEGSYTLLSPSTPSGLHKAPLKVAAKEAWTDCERRLIHPVHPSPPQVASEISLPTEWTY